MDNKGKQHSGMNRRNLMKKSVAMIGAGIIASLPGNAGESEANSEFEKDDNIIYNVKKYGASGLPGDNATKAVRAAVEECADAGGGTVYVPPGNYTVGTIQLKDNVTLYLEAGATFYLSQDREDFIPGARAMIFAENVKNITISGRGTLNGLAQHEFLEMKGIDPEIAGEIEIARKAGVEMRRYYVTGMSAFMCILNNCTNVLISGISLLRSPLWNIRLNDCYMVCIRGIYISSDLEKGVTSDGIDVCSSKNVTISDSVISTGDDCIVLKTPLLRGQETADTTENVVVTNCILTSSSTPLKIGTESHADIRHVVFSNCTIRNSNKGFGIDVRDGGTVSDVVFSNLTIDTNRRHWNWWGSAETCKIVLKKRNESSRLGKIENIRIENILSHVRGTSNIKGTHEQSLQNIRINSMQIFMNPEDAPDKRAIHALKISDVNELAISDLSVKWNDKDSEAGWKSALVIENVNDFEIRAVTCRQGIKGKNEPAILINNSSDGFITGCRATENTNTYLNFSGDKCSDIVVSNNDLRKSKEKISFENEKIRSRITVMGF